jgi:hypothetical protein
MKIKYKNGPVKFGSLNRGSIFRLIDTKDVIMKIVEPNANNFYSEDCGDCSNAVCLRTGECSLFDDDDDVIIVDATLLIE